MGVTVSMEMNCETDFQNSMKKLSAVPDTLWGSVGHRCQRTETTSYSVSLALFAALYLIDL